LCSPSRPQWFFVPRFEIVTTSPVFLSIVAPSHSELSGASRKLRDMLGQLSRHTMVPAPSPSGRFGRFVCFCSCNMLSGKLANIAWHYLGSAFSTKVLENSCFLFSSTRMHLRALSYQLARSCHARPVVEQLSTAVGLCGRFVQGGHTSFQLSCPAAVQFWFWRHSVNSSKSYFETEPPSAWPRASRCSRFVFQLMVSVHVCGLLATYVPAIGYSTHVVF